MTAAPSLGLLSPNLSSASFSDYSSPSSNSSQTSFLQTLQDAQRSSDQSRPVDDSSSPSSASSSASDSGADSSNPTDATGSTDTSSDNKTRSTTRHVKNHTKVAAGSKKSKPAGGPPDHDEALEKSDTAAADSTSAKDLSAGDAKKSLSTKAGAKKSTRADAQADAPRTPTQTPGITPVVQPGTGEKKSATTAKNTTDDAVAKDSTTVQAIDPADESGAAEQTAATAGEANVAQAKPVKPGGGLGSAKVLSAGKSRAANVEDSDAAADGDATTASGSAEDSTNGFQDILAAMTAVDPDEEKAPASPHATTDASDPSAAVGAAAVVAPTHAGKSSSVTATAPAESATPATAAETAETNHARIVSSIHGQLLPNGGSMMIRLDPPELGTVQVAVHMRNGVLTAEFETSNDDATKMLSRSLGQLKTSLEAAGVSVEKLHVQQSSKQQGGKSSSDDSGSGRSSTGDSQTRQQGKQQQQRRDLMDKLWRKMSGVDEPMDLVA